MTITVGWLVDERILVGAPDGPWSRSANSKYLIGQSPPGAGSDLLEIHLYDCVTLTLTSPSKLAYYLVLWNLRVRSKLFVGLGWTLFAACTEPCLLSPESHCDASVAWSYPVAFFKLNDAGNSLP